jgi:hypothetical protein
MQQNIYTGTDNGRVLMIWKRMQYETARLSLIQSLDGFFLSTT